MNSILSQKPIPKSARKKRVLRTPAQWQVLIAEFESGDLTARAFCNKHQIAVSGLHKWRHHFSQTTCSSGFIDIGAQINSSALQPLPASPIESDSTRWQIELDIGHGMRLRVYRAYQN
jgi:hypothetical protein